MNDWPSSPPPRDVLPDDLLHPTDETAIASEQDEAPYCEAQVGGMMCGQPVKKWGHQCTIHDPEGKTR